MENITQEFSTKAKSFIKKAENIIIVAHKNPDGDALGAGLAMYHLFKNLGKTVNFIVPNQLPVYLNWMPSADNIIVYENKKEFAAKIIGEANLIVMADFSNRGRMSEMGDKIIPLKVPKILIDHHPNPEDIADITYSRTTASSTAEMVYEFIDSLYGKKEIDINIANCLFVGIMTDTGCFNYNSSKPFTFEAISNLLVFGVNKDDIIDRVYNNYSEHRLRLLGHAINSNMKVMPEYGTAYIYLTQTDLANYNFEPGDTEGFVNYPLSIKGIVFTAIFIEKDNYTKCSFRSKGNFPANLVAKDHFGGGGHKNAAGGENKELIKETIAKFESVLPQYKKYLNV